MTEVVGESVGVLQHEDKAFGMQVLNIKTLGGWPKGYEHFGYIHEEKGGVTRYPYYECVAWPLKEVSVLQAYTRNWKKERFHKVMGSDIPQIVPGIEGKDAMIIGSKLALFYCERDELMDIIATIEIGEGLPHPIIEGEWGKISKEATRSYIISDFTKETVMNVAHHAKLAGFKYIYHEDPWRSWGKFKINCEGGAKSLGSVIRSIEAEKGIRVGSHTLSNFIHGHDPYVSPVPDQRLVKIGGTTLVKDLEEKDEEIYIKDDMFFQVDMSGRNIKECFIDQEIIRYLTLEKISEGEYKLGGCKRGHRGTSVSNYKEGEEIKRLSTHYYDTLFPNLNLQDEMTENLIEAFNDVGMKQISFDGLEGCRYLGYEDYGCNKMVADFFEGLKNKEDFINDASIVTPYLWHIHTRMNWGEPWGEGMREGQMTIRYDNQDYHRRNLLPPMFGWFILGKKTPMIDIEWMLSKAAGFDAGFALYTTTDQLTGNGQSKEICKKINLWETARLSGAFTEEQKKCLQVKENEWYLEEVVEGEKWLLRSVNYPAKPLVKKFDQFQPGSTGVDWPYINEMVEQLFHFELQVLDGGKIVNPGFLLAKGSVAFNTEVEDGQYLSYQGGGEAIKYDCCRNEIEKVKALINGNVVFIEDYQLISLSADEWENPNGSAQVRFITMGEPEEVFAGNVTQKPRFSIKTPESWNLNEEVCVEICLEDIKKSIQALEFVLGYEPERVQINEILHSNHNMLVSYKEEEDIVKVVIAFLPTEVRKEQENLITLKLKVSEPQKKLLFKITKGHLIDEQLKKETLDLYKESFDVGITMDYEMQQRLLEMEEQLADAKEGMEIGQYIAGTLTRVRAIVDSVKGRYDDKFSNIDSITLFYELGKGLEILNRGCIKKETGDMNQDGDITLEDVALAVKYYKEPITQELSYQSGDVDGDGEIGLFDLKFILDKTIM